MKISSLIFFILVTFSVKAEPKHKLDFQEPIKLKRVWMKPTLPTKLALLYKDIRPAQKL